MPVTEEHIALAFDVTLLEAFVCFTKYPGQKDVASWRIFTSASVAEKVDNGIRVI